MKLTKKFALFLLRLAVTVCLLFLLSRKINLTHLLQVLTQVTWTPVWITVGIVLAVRLITYWRIWLLLKVQKVFCRFLHLIEVYWICDFGAFFLPGLVGGDILRIVGLQAFSRDVNKSGSAVLMERFLDLYYCGDVAV